MAQVSCSFPDQTYTASNKPPVETIKSDIALLEAANNDTDSNSIKKGGTVAFTGAQSMGNNKLTNLQAATNASDAVRLDQVYPVGSLYFNASVSTNPGTLLGFGTWASFGAGRMLMGFNSADSDFDTVEKTGGAKTHTLTEAEMPVHTHIQDAHTHTQDAHLHQLTNLAKRSAAYDSGSNNSAYDIGVGNFNSDATTATNQNTTATNQNAGSGAAHSILNPYITVFIWKRTA